MIRDIVRWIKNFRRPQWMREQEDQDNLHWQADNWAIEIMGYMVIGCGLSILVICIIVVLNGGVIF